MLGKLCMFYFDVGVIEFEHTFFTKVVNSKPDAFINLVVPNVAG